ncbi:TSL-kinase interacting protein 1 [Salvia miltiorrhiza]|uniref:TSL-kinase interacting protein 1 n=1 Tax=Salvia miltiorrhiza TaxID=226208 RepID=UPI0025ACF6C9|nr:TSL-kinase interacting protein 1 [Salvia miltiorrhiza]XP_057805366.1 TSL-kinase interacting protein 1 [Salvia miltiorrhiza]XP_057805367.1 TSL-kinase interacting protein 1 [Salvia miltiorrhiza]XP_057805368.1 TSL-kinase interacting protein 1 [Salvia miltiorrhiza]XP_057805369.1 TSL-kinase interacting protein 1 [Salvia miltiorrhiza]XP_057805370.1 TSL-kinase interacting protein 1 [Salvia miltiorrhiza]
MVTQVSLDCELCLCPDNLGNKDGNSSIPSSSQEQAAPQMPVKKPTRQWAAWTRQEEESFFAALRQVGKNFEKITSRVQSKNKDQVRHYYYRLVRRMNKLLGPELCLDAKNSKDTNAAMLRWWSLLEKYSCKASKLHLKPRRFKIFVETLENQLLRDRKKNTKKRLSTGENNTSVPNITNQVKASGHDNRAVKMVLLDSQNIEKVGTGKGSLFKRHANIGMSRNNCKVDQASVKTVKHRRKNGLASAAAYKRWEKAAIAGVSLVADAAEQLERVDTDKETEYQETPGHNGPQLVGEMVHSLQKSARNTLNEDNSQNPSKLKLQLFPIDDITQKDLERNHHNPHLELTLSTRKKISSVVEHLNRKWGDSRLLDQELMLFPYWAQRENLVGYQKWSKDSTLCAADVYYQVGSPPVFRLRYGWFAKSEIESATAQALSRTNINEARQQNAETKNPSSSCDYRTVSTEPITTLTPSSASTPNITVACDIPVSNVSTSRYADSTAIVSLPRKASGDLIHTRQVENTKDTALSAVEWADSLTNISMGELLSESTPNTDAKCSDFPGPLVSSCQQIPFNCDSFDAAIAAHIFKHQTKVQQQVLASHAPSIFDAEETCDAFSFQKTSAFFRENHNASMNGYKDTPKQPTITSPSVSHRDVEELPGAEKLTNNNRTCEDLVDECESDNPTENPTKDFSGLTDIYWPDSLGPLDLDIPSCRYQSNDLILSDSLGGLNRLIANSLDAFQSCSFFGSDKKEAAPKAETHQNTPFSDFKIGSEV